MGTQLSGIKLEDFYGRKPMDPDIVLRSMSRLEERLAADSKERFEFRRQCREQFKKLRTPFLDQVSRNKEAAQVARELKRLFEERRHHKIEPPATKKGETTIFTGPFAAEIAPPYNYQWT